MDETSPVYQNFLNRMKFSRPIREATRRISASKFLQRDGETGAKMDMPSTVRDIDKKINHITALVTSISETLKAQEKLDLDILKYERERNERRRRRNRERKIEKKKPFGIFQGMVNRVTKPIKGVLDTALGFLFNILTGKFVLGLIDFFSKPKVIEKLLSIFKFISNNLPLIATVTAALAATVAGVLLLMSAKFIPALIGSIFTMAAKNPLATLAVLGGGTLLSLGMAGGQDDPVVDQTNIDKGITPIRQSENTSGDGITANLEMSGGGKVPGSGNRDTVPAKLTPGEFVMSKGAVEKYGSNTLSAMNAAGGGTNVPVLNIGGDRFAFGGGGQPTKSMANISSNVKMGDISPPIMPDSDFNMSMTTNTTISPQDNTNVAAITNTITIPHFYVGDGDDDVKDTLGLVS